MKPDRLIPVLCLALLFGCNKPEQPVKPTEEKNEIPVVFRDSSPTPEKTTPETTTAEIKTAEKPAGITPEKIPEKKTTISEPARQAELTTNDLALVDNIPVKADEFYRVFAGKALDTLPNYLRREYDKQRKEFIDRLISNKLFEYAASKEDFSQDPKYTAAVDDALRKVNMQYFYDRYIASKVKIDEKDSKEYYNKHSDNYISPERIRVRHILVELKPNAFMAEATHAREKIEKLRQRVMEGESFEAVAGAESDCPSKGRGGDLGFFQRGEMEAKFEKAAFALEKNEISDIVETEFGYHIIKLIDRIPQRQQPYDDVKTEIRNELQVQMEQQLYLDILKSLTNKYEVIRNEELIRKLVN
jgi:peptidyl-prolyl cis-trans isomerase C